MNDIYMFYEESPIQKYKYIDNMLLDTPDTPDTSNPFRFPAATGYPFNELVKNTAATTTLKGGMNFERFKNLIVPLGFVLSHDEKPKYRNADDKDYEDIIDNEKYNILFNMVGNSKTTKKNKTKKSKH
jgi:hypothetical protein